MMKFRNGKVYVGQTIHTHRSRCEEHVREAKRNDEKPQCRYLNSAIRKALANKEKIRVIVLFQCADEDLNLWEVFFVAQYKANNREFGYNLTAGGGYRLEHHTEESRDKMSESVRQHKNYDLPRNVVEMHDASADRHGFVVIVSANVRHGFTSMNKTMDQKYAEAMACYNAIKNGETWEHKNKFKRGNEELDVPRYIVKHGVKGFQINIGPNAFPDLIPGGFRKSFTRKTREENLADAIHYLRNELCL